MSPVTFVPASKQIENLRQELEQEAEKNSRLAAELRKLGLRGEIPTTLVMDLYTRYILPAVEPSRRPRKTGNKAGKARAVWTGQYRMSRPVLES